MIIHRNTLFDVFMAAKWETMNIVLHMHAHYKDIKTIEMCITVNVIHLKKLLI